LLRSTDYAGANVTVPHKEAVIAFLDGLTPVAQAIGAVNTIVKQDDRLIGHNTDAAGLLADWHNLGVDVARKRVLIMGAGGVARAAVAACAGVGAQIRIVARRHVQADSLEGVGRVEVFPWTRLGLMQASDDCLLVANCTPLGMWPDVDASPWLETVPWPSGAFAYDMVYNPPETRFVRQARKARLRAETGLGMLVEQGALAFELWTGRTAPRPLMRRAAERALVSPPVPSSPAPRGVDEPGSPEA
jgi:shikimate dehydrogenase